MFGKKQDRQLDAAVAAVRDEAVDPQVIESASQRTLALLREGGPMDAAPEGIRSCADVRGRLAAFRERRLAPAVALLVEDHLRECASCRAVAEEREDVRAVALRWAAPAPARRGRPTWQWLSAAAGVALAVSAGLMGYRAYFGPTAGPRATVTSATGALLALDAQGALRPSQVGDVLREGESLRTPRSGNALVKLADGSQVEMDERAQLSVSARGVDTTLHLERGNIIVRAAKRSRGHLYVATADCRVAVTGTIFSVSHGLAGSRVSVIEGQVRVAHAGQESLLRPGQQLATTPAVRRVRLKDEVAWSRERERHLAMLAELQNLDQDLASLPTPALRYQSRLLSLVPEDMSVFVAIPNYGDTVADGYALFKERVEQNPALKSWWETSGPGKDVARLDEAVGKLKALSEYVGDEIVIAGRAGNGQRPGGCVLLAEVKKSGLRDFVTSELAALAQGHPVPIHFVDQAPAATAGAGPKELLVLESNGIVAAASSAELLNGVATHLTSGAGAFADTPFGGRVRQAYESGVGLLVAADLERLGASHKERRASHALASPPRYFVAERKTFDGRTFNSAVLAFAGPRAGVASWLAAPAPMGSLEFVSPNAAGVAAFVLRNPATLFDEVMASLGPKSAQAQNALGEIESELNLRLRDDIALALGGEVAVALDGPVLPQPAWKVIVEVNDPDRLLRSISSLVETANAKLEGHGEGSLRLTSAPMGEETEHVLSVTGGRVPFEAHLAFADGYLVVTPTRALLMRALETKRAGASLGRSAELVALMPLQDSPHCSGLIYQNLGTVLGPLARTLGESGALSADAQRSFTAVAERSRPSLLAFYGEEDRIRVAAVGALPGLDASALALPQLLERALSGTPNVGRP